jgi:hypothetical protein
MPPGSLSHFFSAHPGGTWSHYHFSHKGLTNSVYLYGFPAKCLDVELNSRLDIGKGFFICIALSNYNTLDADRIGNITVRMLFYYYRTCSIGYQLLGLCEQICQSRHAKIIRINITNILKKANF